MNKKLIAAAFLANFVIAGTAMAQTMPDFAMVSQNSNTTTANSTLSTPRVSQDSLAIIEDAIPTPPPVDTPDRVVKGTITVYSSTPNQTDSSPFYTANGKHVYEGLIAVNGYPFGTKIKIPDLFGDKIFTVDDRMNARYGNKNFDIWMDAPYKELMQFGSKRAAVEIYLPEKELASK